MCVKTLTSVSHNMCFMCVCMCVRVVSCFVISYDHRMYHTDVTAPNCFVVNSTRYGPRCLTVRHPVMLASLDCTLPLCIRIVCLSSLLAVHLTLEFCLRRQTVLRSGDMKLVIGPERQNGWCVLCGVVCFVLFAREVATQWTTTSLTNSLDK